MLKLFSGDNLNNSKIQILFTIFLLILIQQIGGESRQKRFLTFPRTSPTRVQNETITANIESHIGSGAIIVGIGIPVDLELESVTIGYVLKAEYFLPENASNYLDYIGDPFSPTLRPITGTAIVLKRRSAETDPAGKEVMVKEPQQQGEEKEADSTDTDTDTTADDESLNNNNHAKNTSNIITKSEFGYDKELHQKYEKYTQEAIEINDVIQNDDDDDDEDNSKDADPEDADSKTKKYRKLTKFEKNNNIEIERESELNLTVDERKPKEPQSLETSRWTLYKGIETLAENKGLVGRSCILRSICEAANAPFTYSSGILGELMHVIMSPSTSPDRIINHSDNEYLRAEELGQSGAPCDKIFKECTRSLLDQFSGIYSTIDNVLQFLG